jgi:hypothetical protein
MPSTYEFKVGDRVWRIEKGTRTHLKPGTIAYVKNYKGRTSIIVRFDDPHLRKYYGCTAEAPYWSELQYWEHMSIENLVHNALINKDENIDFSNLT